ncbi:LysR family transcriptional regulator [Shewanella waksmanii]|uniref:LysR family transcriptional regulator n=1 Tax=Shewanella waksmanii TaxID=213783 RepID=UPI00048CD50C|nr:LysR family transcriptional regulator [Shewanella waksmanii]
MQTRSDDLDILLAVVDAGGFSAAAKALDIQVAKVSRSVSRIEQQLNVTLLNRTTRRLELTEEGRQFVARIRVGLSAIQQAEDELSQVKPQGRLRVDAASPFVLHQLVPLITEFRQCYPDIELVLSSSEGFVDLIEQRTDVAIRIGQLADSTMHARALGQSLLYIVASPTYLARQGVPQTAAELANHQLIGFSGAAILNRWPLAGMEPISPCISCSSGETVSQLVLAGNGIGCLSGFMVKRHIASGELVALFESQKLTQTGREQVNAVYYKSSTVAKRVSVFIDFIETRLTL